MEIQDYDWLARGKHVAPEGWKAWCDAAEDQVRRTLIG
jgi:hypothetical protein